MRVNPNSLLAVLVGFTLNLGFSGAAHAALDGRDLDGNLATFEAYYDTDLNVTWLANANVNGLMTWAAADTWAASLSFTDGTNVYNNWRLPASDTCLGYCASSEMGHLFYVELGGTVGSPILTNTPNPNPNLAKFTNLQNVNYWSATEWAPSPANNAWYMGFNSGYQTSAAKINTMHAFAVSSGDVGAVPEAQTYALMLAGLGLIGWRVRRRG